MKAKAHEILHVVVLCAVIFCSAVYGLEYARFMGSLLILLAGACLFTLKWYGMRIRWTAPDIAFGLIDNGILAIMALFGGRFGGVAGAVIGGVVGNAITDGIAGMVEGYWAEEERSDRRTIFGSAVGKMAGALLGAGAVLFIAGIAGF